MFSPSTIFVPCLFITMNHNEHDCVSNHQPHDCLRNRLFRRISRTSKLRATSLCAGNSPVTCEFPTQRPVTRIIFPFEGVIVGLVVWSLPASAYQCLIMWTASFIWIYIYIYIYILYYSIFQPPRMLMPYIHIHTFKLQHRRRFQKTKWLTSNDRIRARTLLYTKIRIRVATYPQIITDLTKKVYKGNSNISAKRW